MTGRPDINNKVIHFTKAPSNEDALNLLLTIVGEGRLAGGTGMTRGGYHCVCFTEAPLPALATGFMNQNSFTRYSQFGLMFEKDWVYAQGARPVIYQPDEEFDLLPETMGWRHVRYEPSRNPPIDFTWEREWRLCGDLNFSSHDAVLVVPNREWESIVFEIWNYQQELETEVYSTILEHNIIQQMMEPCPWRIVTLS